MRFPEEFLNELKSRVRLSDVVGKKVQLKKRGKDWVGLSPFSAEKTPSFYVHDDRGFYKCFSTQKSGDAITFLMETERLTFAESVEKLARDYGLELPTQSAAEQQQYKRRTTLIEWVEKACVFFEDQLRKPAGAEAREYLQKRGFGPEAWARHRMGFSPNGWRALSDHLTAQGAKVEELIEAGLLVQPDGEGGDGDRQGKARQPYDRFRNRVIFPITDTGNRVIAFGARTLEPDGKPKYLNSSDSPLFHKGKTLYRYMAAREELAKIKEGPLSRGLLVTEGYVDAIALAEAGIGTAVAPLGTALTEEQLDLLWRAGPEPLLCFDGDAAGIRAAWRACDRALPLIEPGKSAVLRAAAGRDGPGRCGAGAGRGRHAGDAGGGAAAGGPVVDAGTRGRAAGYARAEGRIRGAAYGRCRARSSMRACGRPTSRSCGTGCTGTPARREIRASRDPKARRFP